MSLFSDIRGRPRYLDWVSWRAVSVVLIGLIDGAVSTPRRPILPRAKKVVVKSRREGK